jgi:hypothetical protein
MTQAAILAASGSPGTTTGFKNRLINGGMTVSQYNGASSVTNPGSNAYIVDRWQINTSFTGSCGQNLGGVTPPPNFSNYLGMSVGSAGQTLTNYSFRQWIEGYNSADLAFGTANAKSVTLSFWVRSSVTGTFGGALQNEAGNRSYPYSYTIAAANTWQQVTVAIPGDTSGTWTGATNGYGIQVIVSYGAASARQGTPGAWAAADYRSCTGQVDLFSTNGATFYITGCQLEVGTTATNFDFRNYGTELALCQRYYAQSLSNVAASALYSQGYGVYLIGWNYNGGSWVGGHTKLPVTMRTSPSCTIYTTAVGGAQTPTANKCSYYQGGWTSASCISIASITNESTLAMEGSASIGSTGSNLIQFNYVASAEL